MLVTGKPYGQVPCGAANAFADPTYSGRSLNWPQAINVKAFGSNVNSGQSLLMLHALRGGKVAGGCQQNAGPTEGEYGNSLAGPSRLL